MGTRLDAKDVRWVINHIGQYGDTDIFPRLLEIDLLLKNIDQAASDFADQDLNEYDFRGGVTLLTPKGNLGFRTADQLHATDQILLLTSLLTMGPEIEKIRADEMTAFSYRFKPNNEHSLFKEDCHFGNWLSMQAEYLKDRPEVKFVLSTDIADFYQRIGHHRLENSLGATSRGKDLGKFVMKLLSRHRAKMSFGLPVGNNASRMLAELLLNDMDQALLSEGFTFTRYVDDYRFFVVDNREAMRILTFLAEHLWMSEGLSLSKQKTHIYDRDLYLKKFLSEDEKAEVEDSAIRELSNSIYGDEEPDPDALDRLISYNLIERLEGELEKVDPDTNRVKLLMYGIRSVRDVDAVVVISKNLHKLIPFMRETVVLLAALADETPSVVEALKPKFFEMLLSNFPYLVSTKVWMLELFAQGVFQISPAEFIQLSQSLKSEDPLLQRQLHMTARKAGNQGYFRVQKAKFDLMNEWTKPSFILGASCLPEDEFYHWFMGVRSRFDPLLRKSFEHSLITKKTK